MALLLIAITPLLWALPAALMTAELASAIPAEGGYYVWVRRALGPFWGFLCGWWTWVFSWVDVAIYPVLFAGYVKALFHLYGRELPFDQHPFLRWAVGMIIVIPLTYLNIRGIRMVGKVAVWFFVALLAPFVVMIACGLPGVAAHSALATTPHYVGKSAYEAFTSGLFVVMWNYLGWDSMSTVAAEVEDPGKSFPKALAICVPLVTLTYLLPVLVGNIVLRDPEAWKDGAWTIIAQHLGGFYLGLAVTAAGLIATSGLFSSTLLAGSRIPFALAEDDVLPPALTRLHPRFETPAIAILVSAVFYSFFSLQTFGDLAEVDVAVYSAGLILEFVALVVLRYREPDLTRPYRIPGGWFGVGLVVLLPAIILGLAITDQFHSESAGLTMKFTLIALASGPLMWMLRRRWKR